MCIRDRYEVNRSPCAVHGLHCESSNYNAEPPAERNRFHEKGTIFGFRCPCRDDCAALLEALEACLLEALRPNFLDRAPG